MEKGFFSKKRLIFIFLFIAVVFLGNKINFSPIIGAENQYFTLFQFFGPIAVSFLGIFPGIVSVLSAELLDSVISGKAFTIINIIRLMPMLFAAYYFGSKKKTLSAIIPLIMIVLFVIHPIGRQAWLYSMYWLIPISIAIIPQLKKNLFLKSLGSTFTAHSIGSVAFIYTVNMTPMQWLSLIPNVAYERTLFALGISGSYILVNTLLAKLDNKFKFNLPEKIVDINKKLILSKHRNSIILSK